MVYFIRQATYKTFSNVIGRCQCLSKTPSDVNKGRRKMDEQDLSFNLKAFFKRYRLDRNSKRRKILLYLCEYI